MLLAQRVSNGGHQHRRRRCSSRGQRHRRKAVSGSRAASAESESREGEVRLLKERRQGAIRSSCRPRRDDVAACRGERDDGGVAGAGAGRRADVHGGDRAEPRLEQQPSGVDIARRVRPHMVPLHRLHLHARRGRGFRSLAMKDEALDGFLLDGFASSVSDL